jgi:proton glutamate symport protein
VILLGIDEIMDMARTATNVLGNCLATVAVARWEGEFKDEGNEVIPPGEPVLSPQAHEHSVS